MKGYNSLTVNQATMRDAVQYYFDNVLFNLPQSPEVIGVSVNNEGSEFKIRTKEPIKYSEEGEHSEQCNQVE